MVASVGRRHWRASCVASIAITLLGLVTASDPLVAQIRQTPVEFPRCKEMCSAAEIRPFFEARAGKVACSLMIGLRIDRSGQVDAVDIVESGEIPACDRAAEEWARSSRWSPARDAEGRPVPVWITQPMRYVPLEA
jgi:TonB family protein